MYASFFSKLLERRLQTYKGWVQFLKILFIIPLMKNGNLPNEGTCVVPKDRELWGHVVGLDSRNHSQAETCRIWVDGIASLEATLKRSFWVWQPEWGHMLCEGTFGDAKLALRTEQVQVIQSFVGRGQNVDLILHRMDSLWGSRKRSDRTQQAWKNIWRLLLREKRTNGRKVGTEGGNQRDSWGVSLSSLRRGDGGFT